MLYLKKEVMFATGVWN